MWRRSREREKKERSSARADKHMVWHPQQHRSMTLRRRRPDHQRANYAGYNEVIQVPEDRVAMTPKAQQQQPLCPPLLPWHECHDVLHRIFSKSSNLSDVLSFRLVCKFWHRTLGTIHHVRRQFTCCTCLETDEVFWLRPEQQNMHSCPSPTMISRTDGTCWKSVIDLSRGYLHTSAEMVASAHGLICVQIGVSLIICNPKSGNHRMLPRFSHISNIDSVGISCNLVKQSYTVIATGKGDSTSPFYHEDGSLIRKPYYISHVEIYCSEAGSWEHHSSFLTDEGVKKVKSIVWWHGCFHCLVQQPEKTSVLHLAYNMITREWAQVSTICVGSAYDEPNLFVWNDWLVCKAPYGKWYWKGHVDPSLSKGELSKLTWIPLYFSDVKHGRSVKDKPRSLHVAIHSDQGDLDIWQHSDQGNLTICIYNPYTQAPGKSFFLSPQSHIVGLKRELSGRCFSFTPCLCFGV